MAIPYIFTRPNVVFIYEVLMAMTVTMTALWAVTPYNLVDIIINIVIYLTANGLSPGGSGYNACT